MNARTDTAGKIQNGKSDLDKITDAIEDTAVTARDTARTAVDKGREVLDQGREAVSGFSDTAQEYVSRNAESAYRGARDMAELAGKDTARFVRERPLSALAIAVGVGVIGGLLLSRRRH